MPHHNPTTWTIWRIACAILLVGCASEGTSDTSDVDGDGLDLATERRLGTLPGVADTDRDGISDGLDLDAIALGGAGPLHRDFFVELDQQKQDGLVAGGSDVLQDYLLAFFANLEMPNPDGTYGVNLVLVPDERLSYEGDCWRQESKATSHLDPAVFHHVELCYRQEGAKRYRGVAGGRTARLSGLPVGVERIEHSRRAFRWSMLFLHELGHLNGLSHGGSDSHNHKPTYPSLMNYRYAYGLWAERTLATSRSDYSHGTLAAYPLVEDMLDECGAFPGLSVREVGFLGAGQGGFPLRVQSGTLCVDWNRDGEFSWEPVAVDLDRDGVITSHPLMDVDDVGLMAEHWGEGLLDPVAGVRSMAVARHEDAL